jgi:hypothetical protein
MLVADLLALARADVLRLPAPAALLELLDQGITAASDAAAAAAASAGELPEVCAAAGEAAAQEAAGRLGGPELAVGASLARPPHDGDDEAPHTLLLALTLMQPSSRGGYGGGDGTTYDPEHPWLLLPPLDAGRLEQRIAAFLREAVEACAPDVVAETALAEPGAPLGGCVLVRLSVVPRAPVPGAPPAEVGAAARRMDAAWRGMAELAARLLSAEFVEWSLGAADLSGAIGGDGGDCGRLALVHMAGSTSTRLELCRRRMAGKLLRRAAKVLLALAHAGHACGAALDELIVAAGGTAADVAAPTTGSSSGDGGSGGESVELLQLLLPSDARRLLLLLEQAMEAGGLTAVA